MLLGSCSAFMPLSLSGARSLAGRVQRTGVCPLMNVDDGSLHQQPESEGKVRIGEIPQFQAVLPRRPPTHLDPRDGMPTAVRSARVRVLCDVVVPRRCAASS